MSITVKSFGKTPAGALVDLYTLRNESGAEVRITNYGGIVTHFLVPDRAGKLGDVVLGHDTLDGYTRDNSPYLGCLIGRFGNRIANGKFTLDGKVIQLACNNGANHLHGGPRGFHTQVWGARVEETVAGPVLELTRRSPAGEEGYPGNLDVTARYTFTADNALRLDYTAVTDAPTIINLTQHSYFNLADAGATDMLGHELQLFADHFTPVSTDLIPNAGVQPLAGTPLDFTQPTKIGARINTDHEQLKNCRGYDHNYVLSPVSEIEQKHAKDAKAEEFLPSLRPLRAPVQLAARVFDPVSSRVLEVWTSAPGVQFYSGNFLDGTVLGKRGTRYKFRHGFCLEPQHFPDSPNQPQFPSVVLRPGEKYENTIVYRFSVR